MANNDIYSCESSIDSKIFFRDCIERRIPAKLSGHLVDSEWKGSQYWINNEYLRQRAGSARVRVEKRDSSLERFGKGKEVKMKFSEFLDKIESGDGNYYLTTQELTYSLEGQPSVISTPLTLLKEDFPINPKIMGNLIVQNINIWYGSSSTPSSSGLHHDFHDNLYIVLRGEKTFRLFAPSEYKNLYTVGNISKLYPNGRINYEGQLTLADGSALSSLAAFEASERLNRAALKLEQIGNAENLDIEDEIDAALEESLDAEIADQELADENEDDDDDEDDDNLDDDYLESDDNEEGEDYQSIKKPKLENTSKIREQSDPMSFSKVPTDLSSEELLKEFPLYVEALSRSVTVTVKAGEMLYLPAGWFHEVYSKSAQTGGHFAFNYWFHPPDNNSFEKPYTSDFWANDWKSRNNQF